MFVDITERRQIDQELSKQRELLEQALEQAQHSSRAKTTFLNNMSHDMRTPMNAIIGFTTLATTHIDNQALVQDYLSKIMVSSKHLLTLINDVLDMSRIESGKVHLEELPCNLDEIIQDLKNMVQVELRAKQIALSVDMKNAPDRDVICDKLRLSQILLNVIDNALKFTPPQGSIQIYISEKKDSVSGLASYEFRVRDLSLIHI